MLLLVFHAGSENVATACRMMMSMMKKREEVLHHLSHIVVLPVCHHHQLLLQTDQELLDTDVIAGKCNVMSRYYIPSLDITEVF